MQSEMRSAVVNQFKGARNALPGYCARARQVLTGETAEYIQEIGVRGNVLCEGFAVVKSGSHRRREQRGDHALRRNCARRSRRSLADQLAASFSFVPSRPFGQPRKHHIHHQRMQPQRRTEGKCHAGEPGRELSAVPLQIVGHVRAR